MLKPRLVLTVPKPWLLHNQTNIEDQITVLNLCYPGRTLTVGLKWYRQCVELGYLDDCDFNIRVSLSMFNPPYPELK